MFLKNVFIAITYSCIFFFLENVAKKTRLQTFYFQCPLIWSVNNKPSGQPVYNGYVAKAQGLKKHVHTLIIDLKKIPNAPFSFGQHLHLLQISYSLHELQLFCKVWCSTHQSLNMVFQERGNFFLNQFFFREIPISLQNLRELNTENNAFVFVFFIKNNASV